jgi:hypothetical protein
MSERIQFIPEIRDRIANQVPVGSKEDKHAAIQRWCNGGDARSPFESGIFAMCANVAEDIERIGRGGRDEPEEPKP